VCCRCLYACWRKEKKKFKKLRVWATRAKWVLGKKKLSEPKQNLRQVANAYMCVGEKREKKKKKKKDCGLLQRKIMAFRKKN
jgi:hypothetical protein